LPQLVLVLAPQIPPARFGVGSSRRRMLLSRDTNKIPASRSMKREDENLTGCGALCALQTLCGELCRSKQS
jgi:hypothetical protein